jgi:hypothetical protein
VLRVWSLCRCRPNTVQASAAGAKERPAAASRTPPGSVRSR